jgi:hypothetical protein
MGALKAGRWRSAGWVANLVLRALIIGFAVEAALATGDPVWTDALFLSILALDMAFNSLDLYEQGGRLDLIPHAYGPAAAFATLRLVGMATVPGIVIVNVAHLLLEIQEAIGDALFATHNVHGWWDTLTDLAAGLAASVGIALLWSRRRPTRPGPTHRSYSPA